MTPDEHELLRYLMSYMRAIKEVSGPAPHGWRFSGMADFLLAEGVAMELSPIKGNPPYTQKKECFRNAALWALESRLTYCEGYVLQPDLPIAIHHAWVATCGNRVRDPTLGLRKGSVYWGVRVPRSVLMKIMTRHGYYGILSNDLSYTDVVTGLDKYFPYRSTRNAS